MHTDRLIRVCALVATLVAPGACSPGFRTIGYQVQPVAAAPGAPAARPKLLRNGLHPAAPAKLGSIVFRGVPMSGYCQEGQVLDKIQEDGVALGAGLANVHTVRYPDHLFTNCFYASADYYADAEGWKESPTPVVDLPPPDPRTLELEINLDMGVAVSGLQKDAPLEPAPDQVNKFGFGFTGRYFFDRLGLELGLEPLRGTEAAKPGYKRMGVFREQLVRLGAVVSLFKHQWIGAVTRVDLGVGGNYTRLTLHDDLKQLARDDGLTPRDDAATGLGYYGQLDVRYGGDVGIVYGLGLKVEQERPSFPGMPQLLDATTVELRLHIGWRY